jgi:SAM-dependent methyltransferase
MNRPVAAVDLDVARLRGAIREQYAQVACDPKRRFHFHTGRALTALLGYEDAWLAAIPASSVESFAGTGNPFAIAPLHAGERVVDIGCGAGMDALIAAAMVGPNGRVIGVDMTPAMVEKARASVASCSVDNVEIREGLMEALPVEDRWADVVTSNGVLNLTPDKASALGEMYRVLRPGGRLQIADIMVRRALPESAKRDIDLWTG